MDSNIVFFILTQILPFTGPSTARVKDKSAISIIFSETFPYVRFQCMTKTGFCYQLLACTHRQTSNIEYFSFGGSGPLHMTMYLGSTLLLGRVAEVVRGHRGPPPKSLDSDENLKPEHTLFCREVRFVAIYALFGDL